MVRRVYQKAKSSIWLYPLLYSFLALFLSILVTWVDKAPGQRLMFDLPAYFYTTSRLARDVLGIIAAAFITISTFTFSTTMVVITMYSSQFTPRVVENFLNNETTMKSFGVFLSGFIYSILTLLFLTNTGEESSLIAASVGVIYIIVGFVNFLLFIQNVSSHVQASGLIARLYEESKEAVDEYCETVEGADHISHTDLRKQIEDKDMREITAPQDGYLQEIEVERLLKTADAHGLVIIINKVVGQFITENTPMLSVYEKDKQLEDEEIETLRKCFVIGHERTEVQDFGFTIIKIEEIALKALSAGINDPNTALHCIKYLGLLMRNLSAIEKGFLHFKKENGEVYLEAQDFEILLIDAYHHLVHFGQNDAFVMREIFKSLRYAKASATAKNSGIIQEYSDAIYKRLMEEESYDAIEHRLLETEYHHLKDL